MSATEENDARKKGEQKLKGRIQDFENNGGVYLSKVDL